jgi:DNA-binding beta-propeller fold protein YncE
MRRRTPRTLVAVLALVAVALPACRNNRDPIDHDAALRRARRTTTTAHAGTGTTVDLRAADVRHLEYVLLDGSIVVYDIDHGHRQVDTIPLPQTAAGVRGVTADPASRALFISYGGDGGVRGNGSVLRWDLLTHQTAWDRHYGHGIDSLAVSDDGKTLFVPDGELASDGVWHVVSAATGDETGTIQGGAGAHNTVARGTRVYMGGRDHDELEVYDTAQAKIVAEAGPLKSGVRPFTVNARGNLAFTTATGFLGFQVSDLDRGKVLYTQQFAGFTFDPKTFPASAPSHGISLSPDEHEVYVVDGPNSVIHVFDVRGLPAAPPRPVADIALAHPFSGAESPCAYDCARDGWVQHSRDGRFVYVGDSGDVIDTATRTVVAFLPALRESRKHLEIDWRGDDVVATSTRHGLGYATG